MTLLRRIFLAGLPTDFPSGNYSMWLLVSWLVLCLVCIFVTHAHARPSARDRLAVLERKLHLLLSHLQRTAASDERVQRLAYRWDGRLSETHASAGFTLQKRHISVCVREDENVAFFVVCHEAAHVCSQTTDHTAEFEDNFKWLLQAAIDAGLYRRQDFDGTPVLYCGSLISHNPLTETPAASGP